MIGKLRGVVDEINEDHMILDVNGVGYIVFVTTAMQSRLTVGESLNIYIESQQRDDGMRLFGFSDKTERAWFKLLQNVQGVGAKVALAILNTLKPGELAQALALKDVAMISRAPGVGKKVAERIITELKGKAEGLAALDGLAAEPGQGVDLGDKAVFDAISALANLGYSKDKAGTVIAKVMANATEHYDTATLIRLSLRELAN